MEKIELNKELFEFYEEEYKGKWGKLIRAWRHWVNDEFNTKNSHDKLRTELFDTINSSVGCGLTASDIIPLLVTGEVILAKKKEPREWKVYYEQEPGFLTFRYTFWNGKRVDQTDEINEIPLLTAEEVQKAPNFMKSLVKKGK